MTIEIIPIRLEHVERFHRALDIVARERRYLAMLQAPPLNDTRKFVSTCVEKGYPQSAAIESGELIGGCDIIPPETASALHCGALGMWVVPEKRSQGLGRQLLLTTLAAAREFGLMRVELGVYDDNLPAIRLYESLGFQREGIKRNAALIDGFYKNLIMMAIIDFDRWTAPGAKT